jgi:hypothetical protein
VGGSVPSLSAAPFQQRHHKLLQTLAMELMEMKKYKTRTSKRKEEEMVSLPKNIW